MQKTMMYSSSYSYAKLSTLCAHIGHPLPEYPHQTALDRARGQIVLLEALAQGFTPEEVMNDDQLLQQQSYSRLEEMSYNSR